MSRVAPLAIALCALGFLPAWSASGPRHPQDFCNIASTGGLTALHPHWQKDKQSKLFSCDGMNHTDDADYYYEVYGTANRVQKIFIHADFWGDASNYTASKEEIGRMLLPVLESVYAAAGAAAPTDLADAVGAAADAQEDTPLGAVTAKTSFGQSQNYAGEYLVEIDLH
jgi:hypothetical protein